MVCWWFMRVVFILDGGGGGCCPECVCRGSSSEVPEGIKGEWMDDCVHWLIAVLSPGSRWCGRSSCRVAVVWGGCVFLGTSTWR